MPTITVDAPAFLEEVRRYLRDYQELNRLIDGDEHKDIDIRNAMQDAANDYNLMPPPLAEIQPYKFPATYRTNFKIGVIIHLLQSVTLLNIRNRLTYQDGGVHVGIFDKQPDIERWVGMQKPTYEKNIKMYKTSLNLESAYGNIPSEYFVISNYYSIGEISTVEEASSISTA